MKFITITNIIIAVDEIESLYCDTYMGSPIIQINIKVQGKEYHCYYDSMKDRDKDFLRISQELP